MAFLQAFPLTLVVDMLCIVSVTLPDTPGLIYRAWWSMLVYSMSAAVSHLLRARSVALIICHITSTVYVALNWEDWSSLSLTVVNVVNCFVATGRSGGLQAVQLFLRAPSFTLLTATLVLLAFVTVRVACQAIHMCTTRKDKGITFNGKSGSPHFPARPCRRHLSSSSLSFGDSASSESQGTAIQNHQSAPATRLSRFISRLYAYTGLSDNRCKDMQAELNLLRAQNARLESEKQVFLQAEHFQDSTVSKLRALIDTMTDAKIPELLDAMVPGLLDITHDATRTSVVELILALADSNASLKAEQARHAHHQERLTSYNQAFAALIRNTMDSANNVNQLTESLVVANTAMSEGQHKLNQMGITIGQLNTTISRLTTDLTAARVFGKQDREKFLEVCLQRDRIQHLNRITSYTCNKLRHEKNQAEKQLLAERASKSSRVHCHPH